ncbi:MAG TPA: alkaline phosphatase family protein, partial [Candidatus Dormibacteraeota bacterium]
MFWRITTLLALVSISVWPSVASASEDKGQLGAIKHIVVIYEENHSFDNLYGGWEGVNGRTNATNAAQISQGGTAYACLLQNDLNLASPPLPADCAAPTSTTPGMHFTNNPFSIESYIP